MEVGYMENEKDRFGDTMRLVERAKEDIYFAERDREVLEKLRNQLRKVETVGTPRSCPKCPGKLEGYTLEGFALDRCHQCGGVWLDRGELEAIVKKISRGPLDDRQTDKGPERCTSILRIYGPSSCFSFL
jgi:Zn-finger nucleic acid-binding protein